MNGLKLVRPKCNVNIVIANQSADWCGNLNIVLEIPTPVCALARNDKREASALKASLQKYKVGENKMKAVIVTGGKQYTVSEGDVLYIEKLEVEAEATVKFDQVLAILDGENSKIGAPVVEGAVVEAKAIKNGKGKKLIVFKYKAKKNEKKKQGHRQPYTKVEITKIAL